MSNKLNFFSDRNLKNLISRGERKKADGSLNTTARMSLAAAKRRKARRQKTFKEHLSEESHNKGTYVCAYADNQTMKNIVRFILDNDIPHPTPENELHATIIYSREGNKDSESFNFPNLITGKFKGWEIFPNKINNTKSLVALLESPTLTKIHNDMMQQYGFTYDFDEYKPHVTFSYDYGNRAPPENTPNFLFKFDNTVVKSLDPDYIPKSKE